MAVGAAITALTMASLGFEPSLADLDLSADPEGARSAFVLGLNRAFLLSTALMVMALACAALRGEPVPYEQAADGEDERSKAVPGRAS